MLEISKETLATLPAATFPGRSILITNAADARAAMKYLSRCKRVGFDTETRPSHFKGRVYKVALLQLSTETECFLFRLHHTGFTDEMVEFFCNPDVVKIGLSIKDDIHALNKLREFEPQGIVELQTYVKDFDIGSNALNKVYAIIFNQRISKSQRLTNWEAPTLTEAQQAYASLDAYACLRIYDYLNSGYFHPEDSPYTEIPAEPNQT